MLPEEPGKRVRVGPMIRVRRPLVRLNAQMLAMVQASLPRPDDELGAAWLLARLFDA